MLPPKFRLRRRNEIKRLFQRGTFFRKGELVGILMNNNLARTRFAFVVGTKVTKKATERNLIKRRMREVVRKIVVDIEPGFDVALVAKKGIVEISFSELEGQLLGLLKEMKLLP